MGAQPKTRRVKVFRNGRNRAVRIPSDFALEGDDVVISQDGDGVITIRPPPRHPLADFLARARSLDAADRLPDLDDADMLPLREPRF